MFIIIIKLRNVKQEIYLLWIIVRCIMYYTCSFIRFSNNGDKNKSTHKKTINLFLPCNFYSVHNNMNFLKFDLYFLFIFNLMNYTVNLPKNI